MCRRAVKGDYSGVQFFFYGVSLEPGAVAHIKHVNHLIWYDVRGLHDRGVNADGPLIVEVHLFYPDPLYLGFTHQSHAEVPLLLYMSKIIAVEIEAFCL